jgi:hypothetical protein
VGFEPTTASVLAGSPGSPYEFWYPRPCSPPACSLHAVDDGPFVSYHIIPGFNYFIKIEYIPDYLRSVRIQ